MNLDPREFFIGLMDFSSILLPGALLTYLLMDPVGPAVLGERYNSLTGKNAGAEAWAVFLFASYLFGHLIFLLGSWLDEAYDWARRYTLNTQTTLLARRGRPLPWLARALIWLVFKRERNLAVERPSKLKRQALGPLQAQDAVNTFRWCKALMNSESPAGLAVVLRFEADSKFFRCFAVVLLLLLIAWQWQHQWSPAGIPIVLALLLLALWRYMEQRYKATNQAYWSVITLAAKNGKVALDKTAPMPKGHVEEREQPRETAVREVHEETGVWARIVDDLGAAAWSVDGAVVSTRFSLMQAAGRGLREDKERRHEWLEFPHAVARANYAETRNLLDAAEKQGTRTLGRAD